MKDHAVNLGIILSPPVSVLDWKVRSTTYCKICMERVVKRQKDGYRHFNPRYDLS